MSKEARGDLEGTSEEMWNGMANGIKRISQEILEESKGDVISKETWWWNNKVQAILKAKRECFKK